MFNTDVIEISDIKNKSNKKKSDLTIFNINVIRSFNISTSSNSDNNRIIQNKNLIFRINSERESLIFTVININVIKSFNIKNKLRKKKFNLQNYLKRKFSFSNLEKEVTVTILSLRRLERSDKIL